MTDHRGSSSSRPAIDAATSSPRREKARLRLERIKALASLREDLQGLGHHIDELEHSRQELERLVIQNAREASPEELTDWSERLKRLQTDLSEQYQAFDVLLARKELLEVDYGQRIAALNEN